MNNEEIYKFELNRAIELIESRLERLTQEDSPKRRAIVLQTLKNLRTSRDQLIPINSLIGSSEIHN